ncbi:AAA family ATPase [Shigella flexneri]
MGTGKATLAEVIARYANADVERISAVTWRERDSRGDRARRQNRNAGRRTTPFVDEVHRSTKDRRMHSCHIWKTAPSLLLAQPLKTRRLT